MADFRETVAFVTKRNGAWLITIAGSATDDSTPDELHDCASSLRIAKRLARQMAEAFYTCPWRWAEVVVGHWELDATYVTTDPDLD